MLQIFSWIYNMKALMISQFIGVENQAPLQEPSVKRVKLDHPRYLQIKKLSEKAIVPTRGSKKAAGLDLYSSEGLTIPARGRALVKTDIAISLPGHTYGRIAPRSGLAVKHGIDCGAGVIDEDYTGELKVLLFNHSDEDFIVGEGDRVAQLIVVCIEQLEPQVVVELTATDRGSAGFGSTGGFSNPTASEE
eukprot:TRINITY_DN1118_c1_g1_i1.p2 TRINITY_DN1118_c1_g1~~TRINITY_DN1118_c1_g1_i1.p2  ORF type:complete len:191 (+),score=24.97 TRINITY_DN1118_c1_g1_i1:70-642(+)